jgi:hypothetical protein
LQLIFSENDPTVKRQNLTVTNSSRASVHDYNEGKLEDHENDYSDKWQRDNDALSLTNNNPAF